MVRLRSIRTASFLRFFTLGLVACNAIAGIGEPILETSDGSAPTSVGGRSDAGGAQPGQEAGSPDAGGPGEDGSSDDGSLADANVPDTNVPDTFTAPPSSAGKPGFDLVTGGTYGKSASFSLVATVGEGPGGNNVGASAHFVLKAGVIAVTQPN